MSTSSSGIDDLKEDKKYAAIIVGGSFLISLFTILAGNWLTKNAGDSPLIELGYGVSILGWAWVLGTVMVGAYIQARMNQFRRELQAVRVEE